jgi:hypothetical protein
MNLDCLLAYSGPTRPALDWYRIPAIGHQHHRRYVRSKAQVLVNSVDEFDLTDTSPIARKVRGESNQTSASRGSMQL